MNFSRMTLGERLYAGFGLILVVMAIVTVLAMFKVQAIETALRAKGVEKLRLERRLSPPWTTEWISESGKAKLRDYGIAPPGAAAACPRCGSASVRKVSQFGSTPCKANYVCADCLEPFDLFKCI